MGGRLAALTMVYLFKLRRIWIKINYDSEMVLKAGFMKMCEWPFRKSLNRTDILELLQTERSNSIVPMVLFYALDPKNNPKWQILFGKVIKTRVSVKIECLAPHKCEIIDMAWTLWRQSAEPSLIGCRFFSHFPRLYKQLKTRQK